jgi:2-polyprenyl-3-methyl-5-hydroxy-6-metoxy-1,4-benzoquinol methylase
MAVALVKWGRRKGRTVHIRAIDNHPLIVELARQRCLGYAEISVEKQDALQLAEDRYDYVHASQFLHHFPDQEVGNVLRHLLGLCSKALVVSDLLHHPLHYAAAWLFSLPASQVFRHDARLSVRKGFRAHELRSLLEEHGFAGFQLEEHFLYRFLLVLTPSQ